MSKRTTYTAMQKAEAVALATTIGPLRAGKQLGIPPRNVARWTHEPSASPIIRAAEQTVADRLVAVHEKALRSVEQGLDAGDARLSDRAQSLRILGEQAALAQGRATQNIAVADQDMSHLPPDFVDLLHRVYDKVFLVYLDTHETHGHQRVIVDRGVVTVEDERDWTDELDDDQRARLRDWIDRLPVRGQRLVMSGEEAERRDKALGEARQNRFADEPPVDLPSLVEDPRVERLPPERGWTPAALPARTAQDAEIRPRTNGTPVLVPKTPEPARRRLVDRDGVIR
jgi:hypothetical protein